MAFTFDQARGRYRDTSSGRFVAASRIRAGVDAVADHASDRMADLTEALLRGDLTLARWEAGMLAMVKASHVAVGVVAAGGRAQMTPAAYGFLGSEIRAQYGYLRAFSAAIVAEAVPLDRRLIGRAAMYGQHARVSFEAIRRRDEAARGSRFERNVLHARESCAQCSALSARGWVPLGSLPPIGTRSCLSRCRCTLAFRGAAALEVVA